MSTEFYKRFLNLASSQVSKDFAINTKAHLAYVINQWRHTTEISRMFTPKNHLQKEKENDKQQFDYSYNTRLEGTSAKVFSHQRNTSILINNTCLAFTAVFLKRTDGSYITIPST